MESKLMKYIVYCTTCTINKKIYVGVHKTYNVEQFDGYIGCGVYINQPSTYVNPKTSFQYAVKKYGPKKFIRNIISIFDNEEDAYNLEASIVTKDFLARSDVYNMVLGGNTLYYNTAIKIYCYDEQGNFKQEYKSILEASKIIGRNIKTIQDALKNKTKCYNCFWTKEKFDKLDLSKMHQYNGHERLPVYQYDINGNYECCYDSVREASKVTGIHSANISSSIKLGTICYDKYFTIIYAPTFSISKSEAINSYEVHQYDLDGNYIASYDNMTKAKRKLGIKSDIYRAIKLGRSAGGFQWSFEKLPKIKKIQPKAGRARSVGKYDKNWNLIKEYPTIEACKKENGAGIIHVLQGRDKFAKGFRYKYID